LQRKKKRERRDGLAGAFGPKGGVGRVRVKQAGGEGFGPVREKGRVEGLGVLFFLNFCFKPFQTLNSFQIIQNFPKQLKKF
jgi:hypothetical protein